MTSKFCTYTYRLLLVLVALLVAGLPGCAGDDERITSAAVALTAEELEVAIADLEAEIAAQEPSTESITVPTPDADDGDEDGTTDCTCLPVINLPVINLPVINLPVLPVVLAGEPQSPNPAPLPVAIACADANAALKGKLEKLKTDATGDKALADTLKTQITTNKTKATTAKNAIPGLKNLINLVEQQGNITAQKATELRQKADDAAKGLDDAQAKYDEAKTKADSAITKADEAITNAQAGLDALAQCPPAVATAKAKLAAGIVARVNSLADLAAGVVAHDAGKDKHSNAIKLMQEALAGTRPPRP
jgi:hypothetical protein